MFLGGGFMALRTAIVILAGALLAGCANSEPISSALVPPAQAAAPINDPGNSGKKTLASKVLSAIALERVTGRKPDPARLVGLN
jgi:hypothetical protein